LLRNAVIIGKPIPYFCPYQVVSQPVERSAFPIHHVAFVSSLSVVTQPVPAQPGQPFSQQPSIKAVDSNVSDNSTFYLIEGLDL
jgi:hypothetical protein